jgi:phenylalanyl-tRNA synthetase beta chain
MHAYDWQEIKGSKLFVKTVEKGTKFKTLDEVERTLSGEELMICDSVGALGIAGVMGGADSGIKSNTTRVFLEVAHFKPERIRKASQIHSLKSDASFRFERGTDVEAKLFALKYATQLILEIAGGNIASEIIDVYPTKAEKVSIESSFERITDYIGIEISSQRIVEILEALDFEFTSNDGKNFTVVAPFYRVDVTREADLVEEILRIHGLDNVPLSDHLSANFLSEFPSIDKEKNQQNIALSLASKGFNEIITNSLTKGEFHQWIAKDLSFDTVEILNRLSEDLGVMRQHVVFQGLEVLAHNINRRQKDLKLFEFGKTYHKKGEKYLEKRHLGLFISGSWMGETWEVNPGKSQFYQLYQIVQALMSQMGCQQFDTTSIENSSVYAYGLNILVNKKPVVQMGLIHPDLVSKFDVKQEAFLADFDWDFWVKQSKDQFTYQEISKFPEVRRDLSLVIDKTVTLQSIQKTAQQYEKNILKSVSIFDVYEGKNLGEGKKSYSVAFILQDDQQTLTDKVIDSTMDRLMKGFEKDLGAVIRK